MKIIKNNNSQKYKKSSKQNTGFSKKNGTGRESLYRLLFPVVELMPAEYSSSLVF